MHRYRTDTIRASGATSPLSRSCPTSRTSTSVPQWTKTKLGPWSLFFRVVQMQSVLVRVLSLTGEPRVRTRRGRRRRDKCDVGSDISGAEGLRTRGVGIQVREDSGILSRDTEEVLQQNLRERRRGEQ